MERTVARNDKDSVVCVWQQAADSVLLLLLLCEGADGEAARAPATDAHIKRRRVVAFTTTNGRRRRRERRGEVRRGEERKNRQPTRAVGTDGYQCAYMHHTPASLPTPKRKHFEYPPLRSSVHSLPSSHAAPLGASSYTHVPSTQRPGS